MTICFGIDRVKSKTAFEMLHVRRIIEVCPLDAIVKKVFFKKDEASFFCRFYQLNFD